MHPTEKSVFNTFITGLAVLTIILVIYVVSVVKYQLKRVRAFKLQSNRDLELIEEERKRIAADLHDDLGSVLANVSMGLEHIHGLLPGEHIVSKTLMHLNDSLGRVKQISHNLLPQTLEHKGLHAAIAELVEELPMDKDIIDFKYESEQENLIPFKTLILFRVIQEILANTIKHAKATRIKLHCSCDKKKMIILIEDNGIGFQHTDQPAIKKLGLQNIRNRLELLGARYDLKSSPDQGTSYSIKIPLASLQKDGNEN